MRSLLILSVSLCACTTVKTVEVPKEIRVPVSVPCQVTVPERPEFPFDKATVDQPLDVKAKELIADRRVRGAYQSELEIALAACTAK